MDQEVILYFCKQIQKENDGSGSNYIIPGFLSKQVASYASMKEDIILCLEATATLLEYKDLPRVIATSLWHTVVMLYGKCFTVSEAKLTVLNSKDVYGSETSLHELHAHIMDTRHNFVAHRGLTTNEFVFPYLTLKHEPLEQHVNIKLRKRKVPSHDVILAYMSILTHLQEFVEKKLERSSRGIWDLMLKEFTPEQIALLDIGSIKLSD